jgi:hypothetical protein
MKMQIAVGAVWTALHTSGLAAAQTAPVDTAPPSESKSAEKVVPPASPSPTPPPPADVRGPTTASSAASAGREERRGFLMRLQLGGGYRSASAGLGSNALEVSGSGFGGSILVGGAVSPNLFLYGEFMQESASDPTIQIGQKKVIANQTSTSLYGFGPGIAYLLPRGVHVGGTLLLARMTIEMDGKELGSTDIGYGFAARVGKDFWLSDHAALGFVGQFAFASMADKSTTSDEPPNVSSTSVTLALSGTYN